MFREKECRKCRKFLFDLDTVSEHIRNWLSIIRAILCLKAVRISINAKNYNISLRLTDVYLTH